MVWVEVYFQTKALEWERRRAWPLEGSVAAVMAVSFTVARGRWVSAGGCDARGGGSSRPVHVLRTAGRAGSLETRYLSFFVYIQDVSDQVPS